MHADELNSLLHDLFTGSSVTSIVLSSPVERGPDACRKVVGRPVSIRGAATIQLERFCGPKTTHVNLDPIGAAREVCRLLDQDFRQAHIQSSAEEVHIHKGKAGRFSISRKRRQASLALEPQAHDRQKGHLIREGEPASFLYRLGVMTEDGRVIASQRDKFRQVNRFLEIVADAAREIETGGPLRIVDFGSGKAYLTFAVHHYFTAVRGQAVEVVGVDRRADVVETCRRAAELIGVNGLRFEVGSIESSASAASADIVMALHACDTATDDALAQAVLMEAKVILAAPCCQHELNRQLDNSVLEAMLKHGIVRERLTGLVTDSLRAALLEACGYNVALIEFIDATHTPKNILLRAVKVEMPDGRREAAMRNYEALRDFWHVHPKLEKSLITNHGICGWQRTQNPVSPPLEIDENLTHP